MRLSFAYRLYKQPLVDFPHLHILGFVLCSHFMSTLQFCLFMEISKGPITLILSEEAVKVFQ